MGRSGDEKGNILWGWPKWKTNEEEIGAIRVWGNLARGTTILFSQNKKAQAHEISQATHANQIAALNFF